MTNEELQTVVSAVIQALKTNGKTIDQLTPVTSLANSDSLEVSGGKKIAFSKLKELVASAVVVTEESIKSWVVIESTDALPVEPTTEEQMKAYVLADKSTLYVYVGEGGDTLNGSYQSVIMKGADGKTGPKGDSGVHLGDVVLVNDLTTGGEGNAISAEMGKVLNETVILDSIDISFSISKYLNTSGVEASWYDGKCTDFYACNLGDVFAFTGAGSQSRVCAYDANKDFIKMLQSSGGTNITITINDSTIKYVRASGNVSDNTKSFAKINYKSIGHLRNDIDALNNEFNTELNDNIDDDLTEGGTLGYISTIDGQIHESTSYKYKEYNVKKDSVLTLKCYVQSKTEVLCKKLSEGKYQSLVTPTGFSVQTYAYTATEDMTICICYEISNTINAGGYFASRNKKLVEINNSISTLNSSVIEQTTDDLSDAITGKYIGMDGAIHNGTGFSYKEFSVKASTILNLYCGSHDSIAVFAKKIDDTHYEPLVIGDFNTNIFNYVVLEDMVLAVSINLNQIPKLEITTYYPQSNRKNIENILAQQQEINNNLAIQGINIGFMFDNIAVIGDSMACGTLEGYEGSHFGSSWLSFLAKRWDCKYKFHYANSGTSAYKWLNNSVYGLGRMLTDTKIYNAYFIAYGHNDPESVGSATDEAAPVTIKDNVPSCPSGYSFSAYYKAIINQIRLKAPHAMIFCLSQYDGVIMYDKATYGQAVIDIADLYYNNGDKLVHHLETGGVPDADMGLVSHYSTIGYAYIARMVDKCVNDVVYQYRADTEIKEFGHYNLPTDEYGPWE